jgi:hypothetical protein
VVRRTDYRLQRGPDRRSLLPGGLPGLQPRQRPSRQHRRAVEGGRRVPLDLGFRHQPGECREGQGPSTPRCTAWRPPDCSAATTTWKQAGGCAATPSPTPAASPWPKHAAPCANSATNSCHDPRAQRPSQRRRRARCAAGGSRWWKPNLWRCGQRATGSPLRSSSSGWPVYIKRTSPPVPVIVFRYGVQVGPRAVALARGRPRGWACRRARSAGAAPRTAGGGLCRVARPDRGRKRDRRCHRTRREFRKASPDGGDSYTPSAARQTPYPPGRAVTGPDSPDPASDLKQEGYNQHGCGYWSGAPFVVLVMVVRSRD